MMLGGSLFYQASIKPIIVPVLVLGEEGRKEGPVWPDGEGVRLSNPSAISLILPRNGQIKK